MPVRPDLRSVVVLGSGPIVIGQGAEFDYSGTQACRALRALGLRVALVNSNPATIMTDPEVADAIYLEPLTLDRVRAVLAVERPDALLPTLGGQTALNLALQLDDAGVFKELGIELLGATVAAVRKAESRQEFREVCGAVGLLSARSVEVGTVAEGLATAEDLGLPLVLRPSFTLGGWGGGIARDREQLATMLAIGLRASPVGRVLIEESLLGWKEFELEVMRDRADNAVVICSIENVDPMGVHTGDSITVAPAMTLSDVEYQEMRDDALTVLRAVGVETGGANVQFGVNPTTGRRVVIEMNPRVSRSSALASKATGFPIAKVAAQLAVGLTLDEIRNEVTGKTAAAFEPTLDYVVVKIPRFDFEKFPEADPVLTTHMKSVGEVMAIGRTFPEALQKAYRSLEAGRDGLDGDAVPEGALSGRSLVDALGVATQWRLELVERALRSGMSVAQVAEASAIDPWFVDEIARVVEMRADLTMLGEATRGDVAQVDEACLRRAKRLGFSDRQLGRLLGSGEDEVRARRWALGLRPVYQSVDTCAGEFEAQTPYHYSTYEEESEITASVRPRVVVLGSGPNRIGQGVEFDTVCVHAVQALRAEGMDAVMVNCNPETVSTDYDVANRLYIEPLTLEDVLEVCEAEAAAGTLLGVIVTLGGQTPLQLARGIAAAGVPLLGTPPDAIDLAEDRGRFGAVLERCGLAAPPWGQARSVEEAKEIAERVGYPVLVRPSYVLGGRSMEVCETPAALERSTALLQAAAARGPVLVDRFLEDAVEIDVDALCDGSEVLVCGVMEHIEEAGVHSGDSASVLPPITLARSAVNAVVAATERLALALGVVGLLNVQFALKGERLYVLEANPRASRSVPFVEKVTGIAVGKAAALLMTGRTLAELRSSGFLPSGSEPSVPEPAHVGVKEAVLPFARFPGADSILGPEMRSTGEVIGLDASFGAAFAKSQEAAYGALPTEGVAFLSVRDADKRAVVSPAKQLAAMGFRLLATEGTAHVLARNGIAAQVVRKFSEGPGNVVERIRAGEIDVVINSPHAHGARSDGYEIRTAAVAAGVACITTLSGLVALVAGIEARRAGQLSTASLQAWHQAAPVVLRASTREEAL